MIGAARVRHLASATGFREEIVEKVLYLEAAQRQREISLRLPVCLPDRQISDTIA